MVHMYISIDNTIIVIIFFFFEIKQLGFNKSMFAILQDREVLKIKSTRLNFVTPTSVKPIPAYPLTFLQTTWRV